MKTLIMTSSAAILAAGIGLAQEATTTDPLLPGAGAEAPATAAPETARSEGEAMNQPEGNAARYGAFADTAVRDLVGKNVLAQAGNDVGEVESLILDGEEVQAVVGVGGFLGFGEHDVAIPLADFVETDGGLMLPDATQEDLEAMAAFDGTGEPLAMDVTVAGEPVPMEAIPGAEGTGAMTNLPATDGN